ncbi:uncharacterized protein LOC114875862 isoform X2 [Osmia bicornis bicornis]|uniref:uncharacterized protein LOC114875862 isoform X2 n=1 Tax=Osmia bicornis bicornis TaxID=1437191 RepID=UPI001EAEAB19|nr:uncharacterized protein LOC114875862 isoform X2 [Osmia bicornis bicornis]
MEEAMNNWVIVLHSVFDVLHFKPIVANLWDKETFNMQRMNEIRIKRSDVLLGYLIPFWIILYFMYEKCLNSLLRRMRIPLLQRSRIIEAVWNCGFCFGSICYLKSSTVKTINFFSEEQAVTHQELGVILHKSFYLHRAGVEIFCHEAWIKGWANLLFASFVMNPYQEKIYLYTLFVPKLMLWTESTNHTRAKLGLWLWFIAECIDSMWFRLLWCGKATHWLEICLFPPPTQEAIELAGIQKRHRDSLKKLVNRTSKKAELWQTLFCAVAIKKKIKRIREAKHNETTSLTDYPEILSQTNAKEEPMRNEKENENENENGNGNGNGNGKGNEQ